jgi:hypothetical protein
MAETTGVLRQNFPIALRVVRPALIAVLLLGLAGAIWAAVDAAAFHPWLQFILVGVLTLILLVVLTAVRRWTRAAWLPVIPFMMAVVGFCFGSGGVVGWSVVGIVVATALHGQYVEKRSARQ